MLRHFLARRCYSIFKIPAKSELELWSLPIHDPFALALQAVDVGEHTFKRIGAICWRSKKDDGDKCDPTIFTII